MPLALDSSQSQTAGTLDAAATEHVERRIAGLRFRACTTLTKACHDGRLLPVVRGMPLALDSSQSQTACTLDAAATEHVERSIADLRFRACTTLTKACHDGRLLPVVQG